MLSQPIQEFINDLRTMALGHPEHAVGCLTVPRKGLEKLTAALDTVPLLVGKTLKKGRVSYHVIDKTTDLERISSPALLVVTEEDYGRDPVFAERVRSKAAYFLNVAS